jgi:hypothetical protein
MGDKINLSIMNNNLNRRDFAKRTSAGVCGLLTGTLLGGGLEAGQDQDTPSKRLVLLGLNALARAHELDYFADGHRGASLVAAHLLCVENKLDERTTSRIVELFDLNWASSGLCKPFPDTESAPAQIDKIGVALAEGGEVLRQVGHNAIFAMAIKAFACCPACHAPAYR